jgi:UDP-glucuronate 4-epimerase
MKVLVTGCAGFIGMHVTERLLARGDAVTGIDNLSDYYDVGLKEARLLKLGGPAGFKFQRLDLADRQAVQALFAIQAGQKGFDAVVHLAAQPGVRYSLIDPHAYVSANLLGFVNVLEGCRHAGVGHLVFASSSSVYGGNTRLPYSEHAAVDHPVSLYAATKKSNELMAHAYSHLFRLPATGLRFFTVYGPWGRPDMSPTLFLQAIFESRPIDVFNHGDMQRDFTYIDDVVEGVVRILDQPASPDPAFDSAAPDPATSNAPYRIYNIGNHEPVQLSDYIAALEAAVGRTTAKNLLPMQPGDVHMTCADTQDLQRAVGFMPATPLPAGIKKFVTWYRDYYRV